MEQSDFEKLINYCYGLAYKLLIDQGGEFYPVAALIDASGELKGAGYEGDDEFPASQTVIDSFKRYFENELANNSIRSYSIAFDVLVKRNPESEKTDAIAIECFSKENGMRTIYYFPYRRLTNSQFEFGNSWQSDLS